MEGNLMLGFLVFFPMLGAGISYLIGRKNETSRDYAADVVVTLEFAAMLYVAFLLRRAHGISGSVEHAFGYDPFVFRSFAEWV